jgi:hypothetical protein
VNSEVLLKWIIRLDNTFPLTCLLPPRMNWGCQCLKAFPLASDRERFVGEALEEEVPPFRPASNPHLQNCKNCSSSEWVTYFANIKRTCLIDIHHSLGRYAQHRYNLLLITVTYILIIMHLQVQLGIPAFTKINTPQREEIPRWSIRRAVCPVCSQKWRDKSSIRNIKYSGTYTSTTLNIQF